MSRVSYMYGGKRFNFETRLQYNPDAESPEFLLEEQLYMEIKELGQHLDGCKPHSFPTPSSQYIHDVVFEDDKGVKATIKDFINLGNIEITK